MRKLSLVARQEYLRFARRKSFLLGIFAAPLLLLLIIGVGELSQSFEDAKRIGYVDRAGVLERDALSLPAAEDLEPEHLVAYDDLDSGRAAVKSGDLDVLFVLEEDYLLDRTLSAYASDDDVAGEVEGTFGRFIQVSLASRYGAETAGRLLEDPELTTRTLDGSREMTGENVIGFLLPLAAGFIFLLSGMISAGYLLQAVSDEKENRTVEVLATSLSARDLILGKAAGLLGIAATQLAVWVLGLAGALVVTLRLFDPPGSLTVPWSQLALVVAFFIPAHLLLSAVMIAVGSAFPEFRQSQQLVGVLNTIFFVPLIFSTLIWEDPSGPLAQFLTFFPLTSFLTVPLRWSAGPVPAWQLASAWLILASCAGILLWASPRIFRAGMLRYGQRLDLGASWRALRTGGR